MLKVFLVEDEFVVREGIKNNINWIEEGFQFCGEATDGELAYPLILNEQPDIIITDIKMPFMDGLELSRLIKNEIPKSKIIILSGHEEFSYAQEAIKIGVTEYLLKPINSTELLRVVKQVGQQIINERIERENLERYKQEMEENETYFKRKLFNEMIEGTLSTAIILERGNEIGIELSAKYYQIVLLKYSLNKSAENQSSDLIALSKELNDIQTRYDNIILFDRAIEGSALLIKEDSLKQLDDTRVEYLTAVKSVFKCYPKISFFGGVGTIVGRLTRLSESFENAARAFAIRFILDKNDIVSSDKLSEIVYKDNDTSINPMELGNLDFKKSEAFLRSGEVNEIPFFVEEFLKSVESTSEQSILFKQYILMNIYMIAVTFLKEIGEIEALNEKAFSGLDDMQEMIYDSQRARDYMIRIFTLAIEKRDALRSKRYNRLIEQAREYINKHYADDSISLNKVSEYVNVSPSHFSTVFSNETGKSFIRYLTDIRMDKAKALLKCTDLRCSDISLAVGYKDPHYFSYLFKKEQNCSPMQYRSSKD